MKRVLFLITAALCSHLAMLPAYSAAETASCATSSDARQLDYWLGDWAVASPGSPQQDLSFARQVPAGGELEQRHYRPRGRNVLAYNSEDKTWHGLFVDNRGRVHVLKGAVAPVSAEFDGPSRDANGKAVLNRVKVLRVTADNVEQIWEKSPDNGASWTTEFRMEYSRKKP